MTLIDNMTLYSLYYYYVRRKCTAYMLRIHTIRTYAERGSYIDGRESNKNISNIIRGNET